jgi:hypothetical protein
MRLTTRIIGLFFCLWPLSFLCQDPGNEILESFSAIQVGNTIQIDFSVKGGASCQGAILQRSSEGVFFDDIASIQGICGGSEFTEFYSLNDDEPLLNSTNYYRVALGNQGHSAVLAIGFVQLEKGYRVYPQPSRDWAVIKFNNPTQSPFVLNIYTMTGGIKDSGTITSNEVYLDLSRYEAGTYVFQLISTEKVITGTLAVQ